MLVLLFWAEGGALSKRRRDADSSGVYAAHAKHPALTTRSTHAPTKGISTSAAAPDEAAWVNPSLADATGLEGVHTGRLVEFMLSDCHWYLTNGKEKVQLLRNEGKNIQNAVWTWFGDGYEEYCYRSTSDIKDVPGFQVPALSASLTGEGWQLMHEVKADPADSVLAKQVRAGKTWVNYGLFQLADLEALMQRSTDLGSLMSRNEGTQHTFRDEGIYKLYVGSKELLTTTACWTLDYAESKVLGTITMHTGNKKSGAIVCSDKDGSFSTITVTADRAAFKGEPGGVVFDSKMLAVRPLLRGSALAITFNLGSFEKSRIVRAGAECIVCYEAPPCSIPDGLPPLAPCGHQDVCESCLLQLQKNRRGPTCPSCREQYRGETFDLITSIVAKKKDAQEQVDKARRQLQKAEEALRQAEIQKNALDQVSAAKIMQIMAVCKVPPQMAEEALNTNNHDLELAKEWAVKKQEEEAQRLQRLEEEARTVNTESVDRFVNVSADWDILFHMRQYANLDDKEGTAIAWVSRDATSVTYQVPPGPHLKGTITNNSKTKHLSYQPVYRTVEGEEEPEILYELKPSELCELPYPIAKDPGEAPDAWLLVDVQGNTILTLIFTVA